VVGVRVREEHRGEPADAGVAKPGHDVASTGVGASAQLAAATLATAPIVAFHFRRLSLLAVASNVVGVPIGSALTVSPALAAAAASIAPFATGPLLAACHSLAWLLLAVNDAFAAPRWSVVGVGSAGLAGCALCYLALLAAWRGKAPPAGLEPTGTIMPP